MIAAGLLAPDPGQLPGGDWVFLTRRAEEIHDKDPFEAFRKASALPRSILHPVIADRTWPNFHRGDHDTAVFQAFKEAEVAVRKAGGFGADYERGHNERPCRGRSPSEHVGVIAEARRRAPGHLLSQDFRPRAR
jgi:hypothetical protein